QDLGAARHAAVCGHVSSLPDREPGACQGRGVARGAGPPRHGGHSSPESRVRRRVPPAAGPAGYAPPHSRFRRPRVFKSLAFVLRTAIAWFLAILLVALMCAQIPLQGRLDWPVLLL